MLKDRKLVVESYAAYMQAVHVRSLEGHKRAAVLLDCTSAAVHFLAHHTRVVVAAHEGYTTVAHVRLWEAYKTALALPDVVHKAAWFAVTSHPSGLAAGGALDGTLEGLVVAVPVVEESRLVVD